MIYCVKHTLWFKEKKCPKCKAKAPAYKRDRTEVADPKEWARFMRCGWTK